MREVNHTEEAAAGARSFGVLLALCVGVGALIGILAQPDTWFRELAKSSLFPPQKPLSVIWLIYFSAMAFLGSRLWRLVNSQPCVSQLYVMWGTQLLCAWSWPIALYWAHALRVSVLIAMLGAVCALFLTLRVHRLDHHAFRVAFACACWLCLLVIMTLGLALRDFA